MLTGCRVQTRKRVHPNFRNNKSEVNIVMVKVDMIICYFYRLLPHLKGNVGLVFTKDELCEVRDKILENKVAAPAKAGALAPIDVSIPPQNTGLGPEKTSFFQALSIPTKISKGTIEILVSLTEAVQTCCRMLFVVLGEPEHDVSKGFSTCPQLVYQGPWYVTLCMQCGTYKDP